VVQCQRCGAALDLAAVNCPYCKTLTAHGYAIEQQRVAQSWHAQASADFARQNERLRTEEEIKKQANTAMIVGIVGLVLCCSPLTIAALVLSLRAKANARRYGIMAPSSATVGLVIGIFGVGALVLYLMMLLLSAIGAGLKG
jgi:hypothetical protein